MTAYMDMLDLTWVASQDTVIDKFEIKRTATTACIVLAGYFASLRGEVINRVDLGAMIKY